MDRARSNLASLLKEHGYSTTKPRVEVFELLYKFGLQTMNQLLSRSSFDRASVYRSVELLRSLGVIRQVQFGFKYKLELSDVFLPHHHHVVCVACGKNVDFSNSKLEDLLSDLALAEGYTIQSHTVELAGLCSRCKPASQTPSGQR